ncbi:MAG: hypothetical protein GXP30_02120 [Verrucomicrobia bacterium]|nr:hypothetical protein [Verrucomicrobiota bacterium]
MKKPPSATVAEKKGDGKLTIDFTSNGNFKPVPGTYQFFLRGTGVSKYENNPDALKRATENQKRIEKITTDLTVASKKAAANKAQAQKTFDLTSKNAATASEASKAEQLKKVAAAKTALDTATKAAAAATAKTTSATKAKTAAAATTKAATAKAKAKDLKFAVYSPPITVEIKEAPKPPVKK